MFTREYYNDLYFAEAYFTDGVSGLKLMQVLRLIGIDNETGQKELSRAFYIPERDGALALDRTAIQALGTLSEDTTISSEPGQYVNATLASNITLTLTNGPVGYTERLQIELVQDAIGGRVVTWGGATSSPGGTIPALTGTPEGRDIFEWVWSGTSWVLHNVLADIR